MVSYYYKYNFVSPEPTLAVVKEELKSYYESGAIDDLMFPVYIDKCLQKLGRSSYKINEWVLDLDNFSAKLPPDFLAVREAWLCAPHGKIVPEAFAYYNQITQTSTNLTPGDMYCEPCAACGNPEIIQLVYKTKKEVLFTFMHTYLLKPGNISVLDNCALDCKNVTDATNAVDSFDIRDNKFVTSFRTGMVHLVYYSKEYDNAGYQLIPDNYRIKEYVEAFVKYKAFEQLSNQVTDETFNQIDKKKQEYKGMCDEAYILADIEIKKQTVYQKSRSIKRQLRRSDKEKIRIS